MASVLNRNVHPLYAVMAFFAAAVVLILYLYGVRRRKKERQIHLYFFAFIFFFCIQDGVWGLLASGIINDDKALMISSSIFHISSALAPLVWTVFFCYTLESLIRFRHFWISYNVLLLAAELAMIVVNFYNHFMFYIDETGNYQSTPERKLLFYFQFSVYILMAIISIISILRTKSEVTRKSFRSFLWISAMPVLFGVFQMLYPDAPANSAGLCIACILVQTFLSQTVENQIDKLRAEAELQKALEEALKTAKIASEAKTQFLFNMSHDIRTPMNAILGFTDIAIKHKDNPGRVDECLAKIKTAGGHLLNLINDILEMSRIESGTLELMDSPQDIRTLIESEIQMSEALAIPKSIEFTTDTDDIRNPYIYVDELHLNEVIINLTSNAIKYTPAGGKVSYTAKQISDVKDGKATYRFEIADNGIGMSEEFQKHLFEAFSRERSTTVSKQEGAGLGLSIVKNIVDLAGGTISVKSSPGAGSIFAVELSFRIMNDEEFGQYKREHVGTQSVPEEFTLKGKKVLLVEDNMMNREIATEILEDAGLIVESVEDGEFAVKAVIEKGTAYYDFILMDIQMPVMDGYQATRAIRALPDGDKTIIIALSANAFEEDIQKSLASGMNAHTAKPIDIGVLFETMQGLL